jgi:hypothetical protein
MDFERLRPRGASEALTSRLPSDLSIRSEAGRVKMGDPLRLG